MSAPNVAPAASPAPATSGAPAAPIVDKGAKRASVEEQKRKAAEAHGKTKAREAFDPRAAAKKAMAERKDQKLRLAASDGKTVPESQDENYEADPNNMPEGRRPKVEAKAVDGKAQPVAEPADAKEPEKVPTWGQKLKAQITERDTKIKTHVEREARWGDAYQQVQREIANKTFEVEDANEDVKLWKGVASQLQQFLEQVAPGKFVKESLDMLLARAENEKLKRQMKRGSKTTKEQATAQAKQAAYASIQGECDALRKQFPELDWSKNPDAKAWFSRWLKRGAPKEGLQDEVNEFIAAQRWKASQANQAAKPGARSGAVEAGARPESDTLQNSEVSTSTRHGAPDFISNGTARKLVRDFRAAKSARR